MQEIPLVQGDEEYPRSFASDGSGALRRTRRVLAAVGEASERPGLPQSALEPFGAVWPNALETLQLLPGLQRMRAPPHGVLGSFVGESKPVFSLQSPR
eukprot:scaffold1170_cov256-Pinguiococcus_pyrenoidosus.AAC.7